MSQLATEPEVIVTLPSGTLADPEVTVNGVVRRSRYDPETGTIYIHPDEPLEHISVSYSVWPEPLACELDWDYDTVSRYPVIG